ARFAPVFKDVAAHFDDVIFGTVNTDKHQQLAAIMGVQSLPTVVVFRDGKHIFAKSGVTTRRQLIQIIEQIQARASSNDCWSGISAKLSTIALIGHLWLSNVCHTLVTHIGSNGRGARSDYRARYTCSAPVIDPSRENQHSSGCQTIRKNWSGP